LNASGVVPLLVVAVTLGCDSREAAPSVLDTKNDSCAFCRMPVSNAHLAAQVAAPGEETKFFDDIGCLRDYLEQNAPPLTETVAYVADHHTGAWVRASAAMFGRCPALETPMGSHLIAHADAASRDSDATSRGCARALVQDIFGPHGPPNGARR
jgi:copper chaperone NosL